MNLKKRQKISVAILLVVSVFMLSGFGCKSSSQKIKGSDVTLEVWGLWQDSDMMKPVIDSFTSQYGVKVNYKKIASVANYERELIKALAEGRGPDVFVIHHTWVDDKKGLLSPAPAGIIDERSVREQFVDVVADDLVRDSQVYALPTSVDTLALYYNKDLLNSIGYPLAPRTWDEFQDVITKLTRVSRIGTIEQSAAALGTAANVNRAPDLVQVLMLQSGLSIFDAKQEQKIGIANEVGQRVLTFYTDFANKTKRVYTWNLQQDYSIDSFTEGDTAMMINYSYQLPTIRAKNPSLNFGIAALPQIPGVADTRRINFAAYWPFAVASSSKAPQVGWQFVKFITDKQNSSTINTAQKVPPARRDLVLELSRDPELGVFAEQAVTAKTWRRTDIAAIDAIFNTAIDAVVTGSATIPDALQRAEDQLNQLYTSNEQEG